MEMNLTQMNTEVLSLLVGCIDLGKCPQIFYFLGGKGQPSVNWADNKLGDRHVIPNFCLSAGLQTDLV